MTQLKFQVTLVSGDGETWDAIIAMENQHPMMFSGSLNEVCGWLKRMVRKP